MSVKVKTTVEGVTVTREGTKYVVVDTATKRMVGTVDKEEKYTTGRAGSGRWFAHYVPRYGQTRPSWARWFSRETSLTRAVEYLVMCNSN